MKAKKILTLVVSLAMIFNIGCICAFAEETSTSNWDGSSVDISWYNTTDTEFTITTAAEFAGFAAIANGTADGITADTFIGKTVKLGADIDLKNHKWAPIGGRTSSTLSGAIECTFDGQGHTIYNLKVEKGSEYEAVNMNIGLFGITRTGNFAAKDFTIENVDIYGSASVAAVLGRTVDCKAVIDNVDVIGTIKIEASTQNVGAICAQGYSPVITNCDVKGNDGSYIKAGTKQVGGILGWSGESSNVTTVENCSVENVTISGEAYVGAIAGIIQYGATVKDNIVKNVSLNGLTDEYHYGTIIGSTGAGYIAGNGTYTSPVYISGNTTENVSVALNGATVAKPVEFGAHYENTSYVSAKIGDAYYENLQVAIDAADGQTVTLLTNIEQADGVTITNKNLTIDLAENTFTVTEGSSTSSRNFLINGNSVVTIKNGTLVAGGDTNSGTYGTIRTEGTAVVTLDNLELYNYRGNGLNIKSLGGTNVKISNTNVYSQYGGGIEAAGATITLDNVNVYQKGLWTAPYNSMAISVNGGGTVIVNSGYYATEPLSAEDAYSQGSSHGSWAAGVLNSGGTLVINDGTFANGNFGDDSLATTPRGLILADTGANIQIKGGTFNALKSIIDIQNNLGDASKNPSGTIAGGTFSADPTNGYVTIADNLKVVKNADGTYSVESAGTLATENVLIQNMAQGTTTGADGQTVPTFRVGCFAAIDSANYSMLGIEVKADGGKVTGSGTTQYLYTYINVTNSEGVATKILPETLGETNKYIFGRIMAFTTNYKDFSFRPFAVSLDGKKTFYGNWSKEYTVDPE